MLRAPRERRPAASPLTRARVACAHHARGTARGAHVAPAYRTPGYLAHSHLSGRVLISGSTWAVATSPWAYHKSAVYAVGRAGEV